MTEPVTRMTLGERRALREHFLSILRAAMAERGARRNTVPGPDGEPEWAWTAHERELMTAAVSEALSRRGVTDEEVSPERIWREAELQAIGHGDYARSYALYCVFIVETAVDRVVSAGG